MKTPFPPPQMLPGDLLNRPSILLVDSEPDHLILLRVILSPLGYRTLVARTAARALSILDNAKPLCILQEMDLPDMDGLELCRSIKACPSTRQIPVMMVSARCGLKDRVMGLKAGAVDFISKPFDNDEVLARVGSQLEQQRCPLTGSSLPYNPGCPLSEASDELRKAVLAAQTALQVVYDRMDPNYPTLRHVMKAMGALLDLSEKVGADGGSVDFHKTG